MRRSIFIAVLLAAAAARAQTPADVAEQFLRRYAAGDTAGAMALWEPPSERTVAIRAQIEATLATRCFQLLRLAVTSTRIDGDAATVALEGEWIEWTSMPGSGPWRDYADGTVALVRSGGAWRIAGWTPAAVAFTDHALAEGEPALRDPRAQSPAVARELCRRAIVSLNRGRFAEAESLKNMARTIGDSIGDEAARARVLAIESILFRLRAHDPVHAIAYAEASVSVAKLSADPDALIRALLSLAASNYGLEFYRSIAERAFALRDYSGEPGVMALVESRLSQAWDDKGNHWLALEYALLAQRTAAACGDVTSLLSAEMNLTGTYKDYGDYALAAPHLERAIELTRKAGYADVLASQLADRADIERHRGRFDAAEASLREALEVATPEGSFGIEMMSLYEQSRMCSEGPHPDFARAEALLREEIGLLEAAGLRTGDVWRELAMLRFEEGCPAEALYIDEQKGRYAREYTRIQDRYEYEITLARADRGLGNLDHAIARLEAIVFDVEKERTNLRGGERQQRSFFESRRAAYADLVDARIEHGDTLTALAVADEAKGRALLDILRGRAATLDEVMNAGERGREQQLLSREAALRREAAAAPAPRRAALHAALERSRAAIDAFHDDVTVEHPRALPQWERGRFVTKPMLQGLIRDRSFAVVEFTISGERVHAFVIARDTAGRLFVHAHTIPLGATELQTRVREWNAAVARADVRYETGARRLYRALIAPLARDLAGAKVVCFVPDGALWLLPFDALVGPDGRFLGERIASFYAPSIAVYAQMAQQRRASPSGTLLAFANPIVKRTAEVSMLRDDELTPLPDAEREVRAAARLLGGRVAVYTGARASKRRLEEEGSAYRVVHFATHGVIDDANPMYSHLALAPDGRADDGVLETWQLMRMKFNADLVVLSACDTARGNYREGEGLIGMSWGLFVAGSASSVATQWKISSAAAADLMIDFYRQWKPIEGQPFAKTIALARARRHMLRDPKRRHPFYWAAFMMIGRG